MSSNKTAMTIARMQRLGYAVNRIEWRGWVEYTTWSRAAGAAVLTVAAQAYEEHNALAILGRRIAQQRGAL